MGLDIAKDMELQNYLRRVASMPELNKKTFEEVYAIQESKKQTGEEDDTVDNDFEQNDQNYTGQ